MPGGGEEIEGVDIFAGWEPKKTVKGSGGRAPSHLEGSRRAEGIRTYHKAQKEKGKRIRSQRRGR